MKRLLALAALAVPAAAHAQAEPAPEAETEIVVTGKGLDAPPGEAAYASVAIDRERLSGSASGRLEDVLRDAAGIAQFRRSDSRSAHPTSQGLTLRGLGGNASSRALLVLDGVPQSDPFGGWVAFPAYLPERLASARVTRGGGSGYQGPGALAGTIDLSSGAPAELGGLQLGAAYGSRESIEAVAVGAAGLGQGFVTMAGQYARGDGFVPVVAEDRGPADRAAPYEQFSAALRAVVDAGGGTELQANMSGFLDRRDRGVDFTGIDSKGVDASLRLVGRGAWRWSALAYVQTRAFASGFASVDAARTTASPTLDQYHVPATGVGARLELQPPLGRGTTLRIGADARRVSGKTQELFTFVAGSPTRRREAGGDSVTAGAFADLSLERGPWTLSAGGRLDHWSIGVGRLTERPLSGVGAFTDTRFAGRDAWEATGRLGAALALSDAVTVRAAGYRGWRLPTLNELYRPFRVGADVTGANAALSPERLTGAELGLNLKPAQGLSARATLFWNQLDDAIANVTLSVAPSGAVTRQRQNVDAVEAKGAELDLRWSSGPLSLSASYAYTDARVRASGAAAPLDGLRPAQTASHQASATAGWRRGDGLGGSITARYVGPQFEDDQNVRVLREAFTLDATLAVPIAGGFAAEARGENLLDARIEAGNSGNDIVERATPRTLWLGLRWRM